MEHLLHDMDEQRIVWRVRLVTGRLLETARDLLLPELLMNETKGSIDDLLFGRTDTVIITHTIGKSLVFTNERICSRFLNKRPVSIHRCVVRKQPEMSSEKYRRWQLLQEIQMKTDPKRSARSSALHFLI